MLLIAGLGAFMGPIDVTVVAVALPALGEALGLSFTAALWVQAGYLLSYALALIPVGRLADQWGRLRVWRLGVVVFALGSLGAGLAPAAEVLIASRLLQGVGGGMLAATAAALVSAAYPPQRRGRALGLTIMAIYLGLSVGPLVGGLLIEVADWRAIFLVNLPVAAVALLVAAPLHEPRPRAARPSLDPLGTLTLGVALVGLLVGVSFGPLWGWTSPRVVGLLAAGAVASALFVVTQRRGREPLLDLGLFRRSRLYALGNLAALLNYTAAFGCIALTAVLCEVVAGREPIETGLILVAQAGVMAVVAPLAGRLSDTIGSRALASGGMVAIAAGLIVLAVLPAAVPLPHLLTGLVLVGAGMGLFSSPNTSAVMGAAPRDDYGVASAVLALMRTLGQSFSLAVLGAIAAGALGPAGADVLVGAAPEGVSAGAYLDGYRAAMAVAAIIALVGAVLSLGRGRPAADPPMPAPPPAAPVGVRPVAGES